MKVNKIFGGELLFGFWLTFLLQFSSQKIFFKKNISKIVRPVLAALSVNGLINHQLWRALEPKVLASRASGRHLGTQTLKDHPSGHPNLYMNNFLR